MQRAVYYVVRLISNQNEKEFHSDDHNSLKKVYLLRLLFRNKKKREKILRDEYSIELTK